jgi:glycosyltransferase involved in cell wall biosynthesis
VSRLLWLSNPPWAGSGYGEQTALAIPRLQALGHELAVACNYGLHGTKLEWNDLTCYPTDGDWGNRTISTFADAYKADMVLALCDSWVMKPQLWPDTRMAIWAPVDHEPLPAACQLVLQAPNVFPIAMSRFGERMMQNVGLTPAYVPHSVDTDLFKPQPENKAAIRAELGLPADVFLVGMVAANKGNPSISRKGFPQAFAAFAQFAQKHDDAYMYVHSEMNPMTAGHGISLEILGHATGCPADRMRGTPDRAWTLGMSREVVANMYAAFDVLLNPSMGEGFGIPILEAQSCGVPVIASHHSAMSELTQAGWLVGGDPAWDAMQAAFFINPSIDAIVEALDAAYEDRDEKRSVAAREFALTYDADLVAVKYWEPALERILGDWGAREVRPLNGGLNREQRRKLAKKKVAS